jgi:cytochrome c biogenesis protein CcmG/thiol:disulfide interchange protein DsbE
MKRVDLMIAITYAASLLLTAFSPISKAADSHAAPSEVRGTPDALTPKALRRQAPDFTLMDAAGQPLTLSSYKGKVVLLDFWATWCGGCKLEIPWYVEFDSKYRGKGLAVIGVSMDDEGMKIVKPFLAEKHIDYPVVIGNDKLSQEYKLTTMPMTLLIDRNGRIAVSHTGVVDKSNFESDIQSLLKE